MNKKLKQPSESEALAKDIVENVLGIELYFRDQNGECDFAFFSKSGHLIGLEVTTATNEEKHEYSKLSNKFEPLIRTQWLSRNWFVNINGTPRINAIKRDLEEVLHALEIHQIEKVNFAYQEFWLEKIPTLKNALEKIRILKISDLNSSIGMFNGQDFSDHRLIALTFSENWSYSGIDHAFKLIVDRIDDNDLRKLREVNVDSGHLFVWLDEHSEKEIRDSMNGAESPELPLDLPPEISAFWIADRVSKKWFKFEVFNGWNSGTF